MKFEDAEPTSAQAATADAIPVGRLQRVLQALLDPADIRIDGDRPWDPQIHDPRWFARVLRQGSLGLGTSYTDAWWECDALEEMFFRILRARIDERATEGWAGRATRFVAAISNRQRRSRAFRIGERHYDLGDDLFERMLDPRMIYSCGYWANAGTLDEAQEAKLDLICRKLELQPRMRLLDVGCGWGGLLKYAAEHYGITGVGVTVSRRQAEYARRLLEGLAVEVRLQDYRDVDEPFDRVVSVGMFEHVGARNYRTFMGVVRRCLPEDGLFLLHSIGSNRSVTTVDPWIDRYIFPGGMLPSIRQIAEAIEGLFVVEDWHSFGHDYYRTLVAWRENFERRWSEIADTYGERFRRMWRYYLESTAASFRARRNQLWQVVLSPIGREGGYRSPR